MKHADSSGESKPSSSVKPPKISGRANPSPIVPSKSASLGAKHVKMDNKATKSASGKSIPMSKKLCLRESCNTISSSKPSTKSPSSVLPARTNEFTGFCHAAANFTGKSPSNSLRRTIDSEMTACGSSFRTPLKYLVGNNSELVNSSGSRCLPSTPKSSYYASPASSIDGWSSESSSTSIKQRSNSSAASLVNTPFREISLDIDFSKASYSERHYYGEPLGNEIQETKFRNPQINNVSMCTNPVSANDSRKLIPSALRMPSPKKGYFDVGTSSKTGSGISNASVLANRTRYGNHRLASSSRGLLSKTGVKDEQKIYLWDKKQPLKEHENIRVHCPENDVHRLSENNKEYIGTLTKQVDDLSRHMGAIDFSRDFNTVLK